jgi:thiF family protein
MDSDYSTRTESLLGKDAVLRLESAHVVIVGLGGVGGYALEGLVRAGVGKITAIDGDRVEKSNFNRQIIATSGTLGLLKAEAFGARAKSINPGLEYNGIGCFLDSDNVSRLIPDDADFVIDAIDSVKDKVALALYCKQQGISEISCLGTGNRLDSAGFEICDIYLTHGCPLAKKMRHELKKAGVLSLTALYSTAPVQGDRKVVGSISYLPAIAGLKLCEHVIKCLVKE